MLSYDQGVSPSLPVAVENFGAPAQEAGGRLGHKAISFKPRTAQTLHSSVNTPKSDDDLDEQSLESMGDYLYAEHI